MHATAADGDSARVEQALARSAVYRRLSDWALDPASGPMVTGPESEDSAERRSQLGRACEELGRAGYDPGTLGSLLHVCEAFLASTPGELARDFVRIFGHTVSADCPPYEAQYGVPHVFAQTQTLADLVGFYRAFGLEVRRGAGERLDHLGVELEFMQVLTYREAYALRHHGRERADLCRDAQRKFVRDHLSTWVDDFGMRLERKAVDGPYALYAGALRHFIAAEAAYLGERPSRQKTLEPSPSPRPISCTDSGDPPRSALGRSLPILGQPEVRRW